MRRMGMGLTLLLLLTPAASAIELDQTDDFQASLQGWASGNNNPNSPVVGVDEGPGGGGDDALLVTANGSAGAGGKLVIFNSAQWAGDYIAAGVTTIEMDLKNRSGVELEIRLALQGPGGPFATTSSAVLPPNSDFIHVALSILPDDLTFVGMGGSNALTTLANVNVLRLLHAAAPTDRGDTVSAQIAVDNITATRILDCAPGPLDAKATEPSDLLILPGFEVDTESGNALTTLFSVHNQLDEPIIVQVRYFDRTSTEPVLTELIDLNARQSRAQDVRDKIGGFTADPDKIVRGWIAIAACSEQGGVMPLMAREQQKGVVPSPSPLARSMTGEYFFRDIDNALATGDSMLRPDEFCRKLQVRLFFNFAPEDVKLRLFVTNPRGGNFMIDPPTATVTVFNEAGAPQAADDLFLDDSVVVISPTELTDTPFGVLELDFGADGAGALSVEYRLGDDFSVSMNANCVDDVVIK